jgi:N6-adenosine-specific RNA methylase IME4
VKAKLIEPARVIYADPPWAFGDKLPGKSRGAAKNYRTLSTVDLMAYPLPPIATDAVLFLWRVAAMQADAVDVAEWWGFTVKSEIVWVKQTVTGKPWFGMGRQVRMAHEVCLIATRGKPQRKSRSVRSTLEAINHGHSQKPHEMYDTIERLYGGPYVELFARDTSPRPGWTFKGDQK